MNYQTAGRIGLPAKPIKAGGETYSPREVQALLKKLADLGINQDKIIAQITPQEAAVLKSLGGSGRVNPRTGLLSFDDGGGGGDGGEGGGGEGGGGGGGGDGGEGGGGSAGGDEGGGGSAGGDEGGGAAGGAGAGGEGSGGEGAGGGAGAGGEGAGSNDGGSGSASAGEGTGANEGGGGFGGFGGGWGGYGDTGDAAGYSGPAGDAMGAAAAGYGFSGTTGEDPSGDPIGGDPNPDLFVEEGTPMAGTLADAISGMMQGVSRGDAEIIADIIQESMLAGTPLSLAEAAQQAGVLGPGPQSEDLGVYGEIGTGPAAAGYMGAFTGAPGVSGAGVGALGETGYGAFGLSGVQGQSEYGNLGNVSGLAESAYGSLGAGPGPAGYASAWNSDTGVSGQGVGALGQTEAGQFGLSGPQGVSSTYGGLSTAGLSGLSGLAGAPVGSFPAGDIAGTTGLLTMGTEPGFVQGTAPTVSDIYGPSVYMPTTVDTSPVVTAPVVTITKPATPVTPPTIEVAPVVPVTPVVPEKPVVEGETTVPTVEDLLLPGGDGGEQWIRPTTLVDDVVAPKTTTPTTSGATTTPKTVIPKEEARAIVEAIVGRRRTPYLQSYYAEGYNPEGLKFAMGGPVIPSAFPVTAYTDGQGPVGAVATPPALTPFQSVGYDNVVGSPMAPAPAATAPSLSGMGPLSAYRNTNAMPVQSQVSQNPNVAASMGSGPLAQLFRR